MYVAQGEPTVSPSRRMARRVGLVVACIAVIAVSIAVSVDQYFGPRHSAPITAIGYLDWVCRSSVREQHRCAPAGKHDVPRHRHCAARRTPLDEGQRDEGGDVRTLRTRKRPGHRHTLSRRTQRLGDPH